MLEPILTMSPSPTPCKKPRLQLRSRARDDVLLHRLLTEVRSHEKKVKDELRRADETIAHLRTDLGQERAYSSRVKKEREQARASSRMRWRRLTLPDTSWLRCVPRSTVAKLRTKECLQTWRRDLPTLNARRIEKESQEMRR